MTFTVDTIAKSLADYLAPVLPGVTFYEDPNQQGTHLPCAFLQQRYTYIEKKQSGRWLKRIGLDLTYLEDYNLPNLQQLYQQAAESMDQVMETFPYSDGTDTTLLHTFDREWRVDLDAMHYKFELKVWVELPKKTAKMQNMDYHEEVLDGK